ncbi:hypothetical protein [Methylocystis sp. SB2]|uniref:hypothetical protein n=1 Tax=Methylocystis sp. (strain SB2) TaxID=743836 RepID=UPI00040EF9F9|nr:hypothetical protein [Methylocystis sp. SB2]ULO24259.1 hypothetical protein LNB28_02275 [Methylocystis sp. SB2]
MTSHSLFEAALTAARGAEPLSDRHRRALENPPHTAIIDAGAAAADGFVTMGGAVNAHAFAKHMLQEHAERVARVERIVAILNGETALDLYEGPRLVSFVAGLRKGVPRVLTKALRLLPDAHPLGVADALESALRDLRTWRRERPEPAREILCRNIAPWKKEHAA